MATNAFTVALEAVTPLFLAGAEPRGQPELRPPSFRGALRYWLRAALGGVLGDDPEKVARAEAAVFGSTRPEWGGAGAVSVRIHHERGLTSESFQRAGAVRVVKGGRMLRQPMGRDYLYWSMASSGDVERSNFTPAKSYFPEGTSLTVELRLRSHALGGSVALSEAVAALWLLIQLGGVGSRARRTGGSLAVREALEFQGLRFALRGNDASAVAGELAAGLRRVRQICTQATGGDPDRSVAAPSSFDILHPQTCRVWVLGLWPSLDDALASIGNWLRQARQAQPIGGRIAFGLPMQRVDLAGVDRRASPLWLSVTRAGQQYVGIATLFHSQFLPPGARVSVNGQPVSIPSDSRTVERAVTAWVKGSPGGAEVSYA